MIGPKWINLQLFVKEEKLRNLCRRYPNGLSMTAYLRVASHALDEPASQNELLELAKSILRLRWQLVELEQEPNRAA